MAKWYERLRQERDNRSWTQAKVADQIGVGQKTVSRWERAKRKPTPYEQQKLCKLFDISLEEFGFVDQQPKAIEEQQPRRPLHEQELPFPPVWNIPFQIPLFVGREDILQQLHDALLSGKTTILTQAISGLGGIGKTVTAVKYAFQYRQEYDAVLWIDADSRERLISGLVNIAFELNLPEKRLKEPNRIITAVGQWMKDHAYWLLILDNVENIVAVNELLPTARRGHILLTTRTQATGEFMFNIELGNMTPEEGALLLLRKADILTSAEPLEAAFVSDRELAKYISRLMDGLPLALDQAGAYIKTRGYRLSDYIELYQERHMELLKWRSPTRIGERYEYPHSVATTWSLSFEKVEQTSPAAVDLLRFYTFLHPDAIPEDMAIAGSSELGSHLQHVTNRFAFGEVIAELRKFSLVRHQIGQNTVSIHRLVQAVFKDRMDEPTQREWAERTIRAVYKTTSSVEFDTLQEFERYISHVQACAALIEDFNFEFEEAVYLLYITGVYLQERAWYTMAEPYLEQALGISKRKFGSMSIMTLHCSNHLAMVYQEQGKYDQAKTQFEQAREISENVWGSGHYNTASCLHNLAHLARLQGDYIRAESLYQHALDVRQNTLEPDYPHIAVSLNGLATLYQEQGMYDQAEPLFEQALMIRQKQLSSEDLELAASYNNLANIYLYQYKEYDQVESLSRRALEIFEKVLGKDHLLGGECLNTLAELYARQGKYDQAESLFLQSLTIRKKILGSTHANVSQSLMNLGALYEDKTNVI